jgi:hypothetical protein
MWFVPRTDGSAPIQSEPESFVQAFARRIQSGLLPRASARRSRYSVVRREPHRLSFRAMDWLTAINVGLNDVELSASAGTARYRLEYRRWAAYVVLLSAAIGLVLAVVFLTLDVHGYVESHPGGTIPGLTPGQNVAVGWSMVLFWGFLWPWILVGLHKRPLRMLMDRIIAEVDQSARTRSVSKS